MMTTTLDKAATIDAILKAARKPVPQIVERRQLLGTNGQWYFATGFPIGVRMAEPVQRRSVGFAYCDQNGITYGTRADSADILRERWEAGQDKDMAEFRDILESSTDDRLESQAAYWLKGGR